LLLTAFSFFSSFLRDGEKSALEASRAEIEQSAQRTIAGWESEAAQQRAAARGERVRREAVEEGAATLAAELADQRRLLARARQAVEAEAERRAKVEQAARAALGDLELADQRRREAEDAAAFADAETQRLGQALAAAAADASRLTVEPRLFVLTPTLGMSALGAVGSRGVGRFCQQARCSFDVRETSQNRRRLFSALKLVHHNRRRRMTARWLPHSTPPPPLVLVVRCSVQALVSDAEAREVAQVAALKADLLGRCDATAAALAETQAALSRAEAGAVASAAEAASEAAKRSAADAAAARAEAERLRLAVRTAEGRPRPRSSPPNGGGGATVGFEVSAMG
jgi:hypothetical protein